MIQNLLILGASGFLGSHLVAACLREGRPFLAARRKGASVGIAAGIPHAEVDLFDEGNWIQLIARHRINAIINLAASGVTPTDRDPLTMQRVNVDLPATLARAAAGHAIFVNAGSCSEYAPPVSHGPIDEDAPLETGKLYGSSKAAGGLISMATATALDVPMRHLRFFNIYGPGEAAHRLLPSLLTAEREGTRAALSSGTQIRDFIHVDDAVSAILRAAERLGSGIASGAAALNVCSGTGTSVRTFAEIAAKTLGLPAEYLGFGDVPMRPDDIPYLVGDPTRMRSDLDWEPALNSASGITASIIAMSGAHRLEEKT